MPTPEKLTLEQQILARDGYRCVLCGNGLKEGVELQVVQVLNGQATLENGQTLCAQHNFRKKNYGQTVTGKKMFIRLYELAKSLNDQDTMRFCAEILDVFERNHVNGHIEWKK